MKNTFCKHSHLFYFLLCNVQRLAVEAIMEIQCQCSDSRARQSLAGRPGPLLGGGRGHSWQSEQLAGGSAGRSGRSWLAPLQHSVSVISCSWYWIKGRDHGKSICNLPPASAGASSSLECLDPLPVCHLTITLSSIHSKIRRIVRRAQFGHCRPERASFLCRPRSSSPQWLPARTCASGCRSATARTSSKKATGP